MFKFFSLALIIISVFAAQSNAQEGRDFIMATELLRTGEYEQAYEILHRLLQENPDSYPVFDRAVSALVGMKQYDEAIKLSEKRFNDDYSDIVSAARLGELYHTAGDTAKAREVWETAILENENRLQAYQHIAHTMYERRAHSGAIKIYLKARQKFDQPNLFANEIANNMLITGEYEEAMREYLTLLTTNEDYAFQVQRQLMRFDEQYLFDVAILETEDKLAEYRNDSSEAISLRELLIWLYMERGLHRRALSTARSLESASNETLYAIYQLGDRLRSQNQFELAESAYTYYTERDGHELKPRSLEQLAQVYIDWATFLQNNNMDYGLRSDSLYEKANITLEKLINSFPRYERLSDALLLQAELALDHLKDVNQAQEYHEQLLALPATGEEMGPQIDYLNGRIHLYHKEHNRARIAFTKSNKAVRIGHLADKTRYYLALSDFYSGDYDYSLIQLRSLERQNTSFFANNALQLRLWIQEGVNPDSSSTQLDLFSEASFYHHVTGESEKAMAMLTSLLEEHDHHALNGEAVLLATAILREKNLAAAYSLINIKSGVAGVNDNSPEDDQYLNSMGISTVSLNPASKERIFWARARLADLVYFKDSTQSETPGDFNLPDELMHEGSTPVESVAEVISAYEDLLIDFPQGFYADKARERISELSSHPN
ncbi:MAG: tetratricopeptide repeat protein [Balneolales bacterium]